MESSRIYKYDTMRCFLMFLVIFGHGLEIFMWDEYVWLYRIIYTFHMSAFMYLSGKFAKFEPVKILKCLVIPYLIFQTIDQCFYAVVINGTPVTLTYVNPSWTLWYLVALIIYYLLLAALPSKKSRHCRLVLGISIVIALLCGYDSNCGEGYSISRILVFAPFFFWGYYDDTIREKISRKERGIPAKIISGILLLILIVISELYVCRSELSLFLLYGSRSYVDCGGVGISALSRGIVMATAVCVICLLQIITPKRKIPFVSAIGKNTLPIYLLHVFFIKLATKYNLFRFTKGQNLLLLFGFCFAIMIILGNPYTANVFRKVFCMQGIKRKKD